MIQKSDRYQTNLQQEPVFHHKYGIKIGLLVF